MKYLCLAYGAERDWNAIPRTEQDALLAEDEVPRRRGDLVAALAHGRQCRQLAGARSACRGSWA